MNVCFKLRILLVMLTISRMARSDQCPAELPCLCSTSETYTLIYCNDKHLRSVPSLIGPANNTYSLRLDRNPNLVIGDEAFDNISLHHLNLEYNTYMSVTPHSLKSQSNTLKELDISYAGLTTIPEAVQDLDQLQSLFANHNKIKHWNVTLMKKLGISLTQLDISYNMLRQWPSCFKYLSNLLWLNVEGNHFDVIPSNAFDSFHSLKYLNVIHAGIVKMPTFLHTLEELEVLHIGGWALHDGCFYKSWYPPGLKTLYIRSNEITTIPFGLDESRFLTKLEIWSNGIVHIDGHALPKNLIYLTVYSNRVSDIWKVCRPSLESLEIFGGRIKRISWNDLKECVNLKVLRLHNSYVSPKALKKLKNLKVVGIF